MFHCMAISAHTHPTLQPCFELLAVLCLVYCVYHFCCCCCMIVSLTGLKSDIITTIFTVHVYSTPITHQSEASVPLKFYCWYT